MIPALLETVRDGLEAGPSWLSLLVDAGLKATIVLGAALFTTWFFRRSPASARHAVWVAAVSAAVVLPLLALVLPAWRMEILPIARRSAPVAAAQVPEVVILPSDLHPPRRIPAQLTPLRAAAPEPRVVVLATPAPLPAPAPAPALPFAWPVALAALWAFGTAVLLLKILLGRIGAMRLAKSSTPVTRHGWLALTRRLCKQLGIEREVLLVESEEIALPMTWGIRRPVVLLPTAAEGWTTERLELVLLHELAHVRRLDALTQLLGQLCCAFYWFHPLTWLAEKRMRALREYACDDFVLAAGNRPSEYAGQILDIVRSLGRRDHLASATLAMARKSQLEGRLMAILDPKLPRRALGRLGTSAVSLGFLALALPLAAFQPAAMAQAESDRGPLPRLSREESERRRDTAPSRPTGEVVETAPAAQPTAVPPTGEAPAATAPRSGNGELCRTGRSTNVNSTHDGDRVWTAHREGRDCKLSLTARGDFALTDEGALGLALSEGGEFIAEERTADRTRRLEVRSRDGRLNQAWSVNGRPRSVDDEARRFAAAFVRELGPEAFSAGRVARAPTPPAAPAAPRPPEAPPAPPAAAPPAPPEAPEAPEAPEGWSFRFNDGSFQLDKGYGEKLQQAKADEQAARNEIARIDREGRSESDVAEALMEVAEEYRMAGENTRQAYLDVAKKIRSDDTRRDVLKKLMQQAPISVETGHRILEVASSIRSDEALGDVLDYMHRIREHSLVHGPLAVAYVEACKGLRSDETLADALQNLLHPNAPPEAALAALQLSKRISSDEQRQKVLIEIKDHQRISPEMEQAYLEVAGGIRSDSVRREAMEELSEAKASHRGGRFAMAGPGINVNIDTREMERKAREYEREVRRHAERIERDAERWAEQAERHAEREAERAERLAERAERDAERAARHADREAEEIARAKVQAFRIEGERLQDEARRLKAEAKRISADLKARAKELKQKLKQSFDDSEIDAELEQLDRELESL